MEYTKISLKFIGALGLLIGILNIFHTFTYFLEKDTIVICNEKSGTTIVLKSEGKSPVLVSEGHPKDLLSCIGKSMPFYTRDIEYLISSRQSNKQIIEKRYRMKHIRGDNDNIKISYQDNIFIIELEKQIVIVGAKQHVSPFTIERHISGEKIIRVYMPSNSPKIDELARKAVVVKGGEFHTLNFGEKVSVKLL